MARTIKATTIASLEQAASIEDNNELLISQDGSTRKTSITQLKQIFGAVSDTTNVAPDIGLSETNIIQSSANFFDKTMFAKLQTLDTKNIAGSSVVTEEYSPKGEKESIYCHFVYSFTANTSISNIKAAAGLEINLKSNNKTGSDQWVRICEKPLRGTAINTALVIDSHITLDTDLAIRGFIDTGDLDTSLTGITTNDIKLDITAVKNTPFSDINYTKILYLDSNKRESDILKFTSVAITGGDGSHNPYELKITALGKSNIANDIIVLAKTNFDESNPDNGEFIQLSPGHVYPANTIILNGPLSYLFDSNQTVGIKIISRSTSTNPVYLKIEYISTDSEIDNEQEHTINDAKIKLANEDITTVFNFAGPIQIGQFEQNAQYDGTNPIYYKLYDSDINTVYGRLDCKSNSAAIFNGNATNSLSMSNIERLCVTVPSSYAGQYCENINEPDYANRTWKTYTNNVWSTTLHSVKLAKNMTDLSANCFRGCTVLNEINLQDTNITSIGTYAFLDCHSLESISIPSSCTELTSTGIFLSCTSLTSLTLHTAITAIAANILTYDTTYNTNGKLYIRLTGDYDVPTREVVEGEFSRNSYLNNNSLTAITNIGKTHDAEILNKDGSPFTYVSGNKTYGIRWEMNKNGLNAFEI